MLPPGNYKTLSVLDSYNYPSGQPTFPDGRIIHESLSRGVVHAVTDDEVNHADQPMDYTFLTLRLEKSVNKDEVKIGDVVTYTIEIENIGQTTVYGPLIEDRTPPGFKYMKGRVKLDGVPISEPRGQRPLVFTIGSVAAGQILELKYQLVVGSGVTPGTYSNTAWARYEGGLYLSNRTSEEVEVVMDPIFDLGTVVGKVFFDKNENGVQDKPEYNLMGDEMITEEPLPNIKIAMEDGTIITTDKYGRYSIPGLIPGRHLFRLDERTLPDGSYLTTEKVVIVDITPGIMTKVNFGVRLDSGEFASKDQEFYTNKVNLSQNPSKPVPRLNVDLFEGEIAVFNDLFIDKAEFRVFLNYAPFISKWRFDILDNETNKAVKSFYGEGKNISDPIFWNGRNEDGEFVDLKEKTYSYLVFVEDEKGDFDETKRKSLSFKIIGAVEDLENVEEVEKAEEELVKYKEEREKLDRVQMYKNWVRDQRDKNIMLISGILVEGETIILDGMNEQLTSVSILKGGELVVDIPLAEKHGFTAKELLEGRIPDSQDEEPIDVILPMGDYEVMVQTIDLERQVGLKSVDVGDLTLLDDGVATETESIVPVSSYSKTIRVGEDYMFMVALGDAKVGYTMTKGSVEPIQHDDKFRNGLWSEGKMAFYIKGKMKGKYLVTSSFDSERERKEFFRNIDDEEYYPVYGDSSELNYDSADTKGPFYLLVEWDKSSVMWGNYSVSFDDTEFAKFSQSLYGGLVDFKSMATTPYGESKSQVVLFRATIEEKLAHNEFLATGGSFYYLKHKDLIKGSDEVRIEVRDQITGLVLQTKIMEEGADYELDYDSGRIIFWIPVPLMAKATTIISNDLLNGNLLYVVADYAYDVNTNIEEASTGARVSKSIGDNVVAGMTYVSETKESGTYQMRATDFTAHLGKDATIKAEYAETESDKEGMFISTDGGLTFTEIETDVDAKGKAYGIKGDARLFNRFTLRGKFQHVDRGFSTSATTAQQGKEIMEIEGIYDIADNSRLLMRHDIQRLVDDGNLQTQIQVGSEKVETTLVQYLHEFRKLKLTAEFQRKAATAEGRLIETYSFARKVDYQFNDNFAVSLTQQTDVTGGDSSKTSTFALAAKPHERVTVNAEKVLGEKGFATRVDIDVSTDGKIALTGGYSVDHRKTGETVVNNTVGTNIPSVMANAESVISDTVAKLTKFDSTTTLHERTSLDTKVEVNNILEGEPVATLMVGGKAQLNEKVDIKASVGIDNAFEDRSVTTIALGGEVKIDEDSSVESQIALSRSATASGAAVSLGGKAKLTEETSVKTQVAISSAADNISSVITVGGETKVDENTNLITDYSMTQSGDAASSTLRFGGKSQVNDRTNTTGDIAFSDSSVDGRKAAYTFGTATKITDEIELASTRTFGTDDDGNKTMDNKFSLIRDKDGRKLEGSLSREYSEGLDAVTSTNIFGLSGDINDKWALKTSLERGEVDNLDGTETKRNVFSAALGYVNKDKETGDELTSSTKIEVRMDEGDEDKRQYLIYHATEGKVSSGLTVFSKLEYSKTRNLSLDYSEAHHREMMVGGAYRPIMYDRLNLLARYTYLEEKSPTGQDDKDGIEEERSHVMSSEFVFDINEHWQISEKFTYKIGEEKVEDFDFSKTHTWLVIHRLNYKIDNDWMVGGEYRVLTQKEAEDVKKGFLIEAARNIGAYAQVGVGWNFTDFEDDLTELDYRAHGPFLRMTGKFYDRTPEEIERARNKWVNEKVSRWAWMMMDAELSRKDSPILIELNEFLRMARAANEQGRYDKARDLYNDILNAGEIMYSEAYDYIRGRIDKEEDLKKMKKLADQYYKNGQYEKAKKILEKILEETQ